MATSRTAGQHPFPLLLSPDTIIAMQSRSIEAWLGASQIMADAMRAVMQRQKELAEAGMKEYWAECQTMLRDGPGDYRPADRLEQVREYYEQAFASFQEVSDIMVRAQAEAMSLLSNAASRSLEEAEEKAA